MAQQLQKGRVQLMPDFQLVPGSGRELKSEQEGLLHTLMDATGYRPVPKLDNRNTGLALIILTEVLEMRAEQAWSIVRPNSKSSGESAGASAPLKSVFLRPLAACTLPKKGGTRWPPTTSPKSHGGVAESG